MSKQIIEVISKAFDRGYRFGKDEIHGFRDPHFIKKELKETIEEALRKLSTPNQPIKADHGSGVEATGRCKHGEIPGFCKECNN